MCYETWQFQYKISHVHGDEELGCVLQVMTSCTFVCSDHLPDYIAS